MKSQLANLRNEFTATKTTAIRKSSLADMINGQDFQQSLESMRSGDVVPEKKSPADILGLSETKESKKFDYYPHAEKVDLEDELKSFEAKMKSVDPHNTNI